MQLILTQKISPARYKEQTKQCLVLLLHVRTVWLGRAHGRRTGTRDRRYTDVALSRGGAGLHDRTALEIVAQSHLEILVLFLQFSLRCQRPLRTQAQRIAYGKSLSYDH